MVFTVSIAEHIPIIATLGAIGFGIVLVCIARPATIFVVLYSSLIAGQLLRIPILGQSGGILLSDVAIAITIVSVFFAYTLGVLPRMSAMLCRTRSGIHVDSGSGAGMTKIYLLLILPFILYSLFLLAIRYYTLPHASFAVALLYWVRLVSTLALLPILAMITQKKSVAVFAKRFFVITWIILVALGYLQLFIVPSLQNIPGGWDPHINRMVSTWLDPNFFGACIAVALPFVMLWAATNHTGVTFILRCYVALGGVLALVLTHSRSSIVAMSIGACIAVSVWLLGKTLGSSWKRFIWWIVIVGILFVSLAFIAFGERAFGIFRHDPTVSLRAEAYSQVWHRLIEQNILFGVGYNAYQFAAKDVGVIQDFSSHSRAGSDSSIFTLLVTTGIVGTLLFFVPILYGLYWHFLRWLRESNMASLLFVYSSIVFIIHAQFENSLLYPHLLMVYILIAILTSL